VGEHDHKKHDDHNQIDADHGEQRDGHTAILASWQACDITRKGEFLR
jgi:hypothetical protein